MAFPEIITDPRAALKEAERRIAEEAEARTGTLNLSGLTLETIPTLSPAAHITRFAIGATYDFEKGQQRFSLRQVTSSNWQALEALTNLQQLSVGETNFSDLSPIAHMQNLRSFNCSFTQISDLTPLANLSALQFLYCHNTEVGDLTPLANLSALQFLDCRDTQVSDLTPLANLSALQSLNCYDTQISDLTPLANLSVLQFLNCSRTQVRDLTPLANLSALQTLHCHNTQVSDLTPLAHLESLALLRISRCPIQAFSRDTFLRLKRLSCDEAFLSSIGLTMPTELKLRIPNAKLATLVRDRLLEDPSLGKDEEPAAEAMAVAAAGRGVPTLRWQGSAFALQAAETPRLEEVLAVLEARLRPVVGRPNYDMRLDAIIDLALTPQPRTAFVCAGHLVELLRLLYDGSTPLGRETCDTLASQIIPQLHALDAAEAKAGIGTMVRALINGPLSHVPQEVEEALALALPLLRANAADEPTHSTITLVLDRQDSHQQQRAELEEVSNRRAVLTAQERALAESSRTNADMGMGLTFSAADQIHRQGLTFEGANHVKAASKSLIAAAVYAQKAASQMPDAQPFVLDNLTLIFTGTDDGPQGELPYQAWQRLMILTKETGRHLLDGKHRAAFEALDLISARPNQGPHLSPRGEAACAFLHTQTD